MSGLFPFNKLTAQCLFDTIKDVLDVLHQVGFEVVAVVSDNHRVHRAGFKKFSLDKTTIPLYIESPYCLNSKFFH